MTSHRYDGWADWYDAYLQRPLYAAVPTHLRRLVGAGSGLCVDVGCGTGAYLGALAALGWQVLGVDISADQLRLARPRSPAVAQADAAWLPLPAGCAARVVSVLTLTDFDDVAPVFQEAARLLRPDGRFILLTTHPCFIGPFVQLAAGAAGVATLHPGYGTTTRVFAGPGIGDGIRARVGVRHVPLAELLNKLIAAGLALTHVEEPGDGTLPWLLALVASRGTTE